MNKQRLSAHSFITDETLRVHVEVKGWKKSMNEAFVSKHRFTPPHGATHSSSSYSHWAVCIFLGVRLKKECSECVALTWMCTVAESSWTFFFSMPACIWENNRRVTSWKTLISVIHFVLWRPATLCHRAVINDLWNYGYVLGFRALHAQWSFYRDSCQLLSPFKWFWKPVYNPFNQIPVGFFFRKPLVRSWTHTFA